MRECPRCPVGMGNWTEGAYFDRCNSCGYEVDKRIPLHAPSSDDNFSYDMKRIYPEGKGNDKYYWFICTPNFPAEQHKTNYPHCHARKNDWSGEAKISLEPISLKVKLGKISYTEQNEIRKLVRQNEDYIHQEWKKVWSR